MLSMPTARLLVALFGAASAAPPAPAAQAADVPLRTSRVADPPAPEPTQADLNALFAYIHDGWQRLRRDNRDLLQAARDPKHPRVGDRWPVYIADDEPVADIRAALQSDLSPEDLAHLQILPLRARGKDEHGVLFLPHPYVVPGGRFNEMYAWDSYFIVRGLLRDGQVALARGMVDNALYEVIHYGTYLNANRSYYLTRSQPPQLGSMLLAVFHATHDTAWLARSLPALERYYAYWQRPPHITATGLSRYHDTGHGPAPEVVTGEVDANGEGAYARIARYFHDHAVADYDVSRFYDREHNALTDAFYVGDRSMRESGFDPSQRFGPFNADVTDYNPACLNALLVVMAQNLAEIHALLGSPKRSAHYRKLAKKQAKGVQRYNWDEAAGLYLDYDVRRGARRNYPFATTFTPLWAGIATPAQARRVADQLPRFLAPGGLLTSLQRTGTQWDAPYGWAPLHLLAAEGLRRYGYDEQANELSVRFLSTVLRHFVVHGAVYEKYDVTDPEVAGGTGTAGLKFGYTSNEVGFGWTNATFLELYAQLPQAARARLVSPAKP